ncbi:MAG: hypothetical protein CMB72_02585 [Euryarchaeota archaeon]|nr:hypothetical protein [Euryarchaeota archaeon]
MGQKKLMILGAGVYQKPLIETALSMDLEIHVASLPGDYPGINIAPNFHPIDITDEQAILQLCTKLEIDGVLTTATDICIPTIGLVVDNLGLSGTGHMSGYACMDKSIMKTKFIENNVPTADYLDIKNENEAKDFFEQINGPCVIKATDSSGSRGIIRIDSIEEIEEAFNEALSNSSKGTVLIEEWLIGEEFGAQAIVIGKELVLTMIHSDVTTPPPRKMPIGHGCPHPQEKRLIVETEKAIKHAIEALGIDNSICNVDLIDTPNGPMVIEIAARMGGTCLPEVCGSYWGIDLYQLAIEIAMGEQPILPKHPVGNPTFAHVLFAEKGGVFHSPGVMNNKLEWVFDVQKGDEIKKFKGGNDRFGHVVGSSNQISEIQSTIKEAIGEFTRTLRLEENK